jgi:hypothetical protein
MNDPKVTMLDAIPEPSLASHSEAFVVVCDDVAPPQPTSMRIPALRDVAGGLIAAR